MENLPDEKGIVDIAAKSGYLKVNTELGEIRLNSHNSVELQPNGTIFGTKLKVEATGTITPTLTIDTKKLRPPQKNINPQEIVDNAIEDYLNEKI